MSISENSIDIETPEQGEASFAMYRGALVTLICDDFPGNRGSLRLRVTYPTGVSRMLGVFAAAELDSTVRRAQETIDRNVDAGFPTLLSASNQEMLAIASWLSDRGLL